MHRTADKDNKQIFITATALPVYKRRNSCDVLDAGDEYAAQVTS
jgi:hypothetical protein